VLLNEGCAFKSFAEKQSETRFTPATSTEGNSVSSSVLTFIAVDLPLFELILEIGEALSADIVSFSPLDVVFDPVRTSVVSVFGEEFSDELKRRELVPNSLPSEHETQFSKTNNLKN